MSCQAIVLAATRWEQAETCDMDALEGDDLCAEHADVEDDLGREESLWELVMER